MPKTKTNKSITPNRSTLKSNQQLFKRGSIQNSVDYSISQLLNDNSINSVIVLLGSVNNYPAKLLIDSGATSCFVSSKFVLKHNLTITQSDSKSVRLANGEIVNTSQLIKNATIRTESKSVQIDLIVLQISYDIILGINWLSKANPIINFQTRSVKFSSFNLSQPVQSSTNSTSNSTQLSTVNQLIVQPSESTESTVSTELVTDSSNQFNQISLNTCELLSLIPTDLLDKKVIKSIDNQDQLFLVHVSQLKQDVRFKSDHLQLNSISFTDSVKLINDSAVRQLVNQFKDIFPATLPAGLPPKRVIDHQIKLKPDAIPTNSHSYRMSQTELAALRKQLDELLSQRFIEPSLSEWGSPVLFVKKKTGELRLVVDYRKLNEATIRQNYSLPRIDETLEKFKDCHFYSKLDLNSGYFQLRLNESDCYKTSFNTRFGSFQYRVLPFGLSGGPSSFMLIMNAAFRDLLDRGLSLYMDDVIIYTKTRDEHLKLLKQVFEILRTNKLFVKISKCEFLKSSVEFLGHKVSVQGTQMLSSKIESILNWPQPKSVKQVQSFLGLCGFYRKYIKNYSQVTLPISNLVNSNHKFEWTAECESSFKLLKQLISSDPILILPDYNREFVLNTDASGFAIGAVLQQYDDSGQLRPIAFYSKKLSDAERNWPVYELEAFSIVQSIKEFRSYLAGKKFKVITDHQSLKYLKTQPSLTPKQHRWLVGLVDFDFDIEYRPGRQNVVADSLSRRADYDSTNSTASTNPNPVNVNSIIELKSVSNSTVELIRASQSNDKFCQSVVNNQISSSEMKKRELKLVDNSLVMKCNKIYIPDDRQLKTQLLEIYHDNKLAGHMGVRKTIQLISRQLHWSGLTSDVTDWIKTCSVCCKSKTSTQKPIGLLKSIDPPNRNWQCVHMDFVGPLVNSKGYDFLLVVIDSLSKLTHLIPTVQTVSAVQTAKLFFDNVIRLHGVPDYIISDRDARFTSNVWSEICRLLNIKLKMSSAFHPETDGLAERMNRTVIQLLRSSSNFKSNDWADNLTATEIAINNFTQSSINMSPFYCNYGFHLNFPPQVNLSDKTDSLSPVPVADDFIKRIHTAMSTAQSNMRSAQLSQKHQADKHRRHVEFKVGDSVYLSTENLKGFNKLTKKWIGPFEIIQQINDVNFKLQLPADFKMHNSFHVSLLKNADVSNSNQFPNRQIVNVDPPVVESIDPADSEWEVEKIIKKQMRNRRWMYLVKWKNWDDEFNEWKCVSDLSKCRKLLREFEEKNQTVHNPNSIKPKRRTRNNQTVNLAEIQSKLISNQSADPTIVNGQLMLPGRIVESVQCKGRVRKGKGRRCRCKTKRSDYCQAHLNSNENLRITNSNIPQSGLGLFTGDKPVKRNQVLAEFTGDKFDCPVSGPYVIEMRGGKSVNANHSTNAASFSNACRPSDKSAGHCQSNAWIKMKNGNPAIYSKQSIPKRTEVFTDYGKDYWDYYDNLNKSD